MIQRIQTLFLILAVVLGILANSLQIATFSNEGMLGYRVFSLWLIDAGGDKSMITCPFFIIQLITLTMALYTIFLYGKRKIQMRLCNILIILMVLWYIVAAAYIFYFSQQMEFESMGWGMMLPLLELILFILAKKRIKYDDDLVRAADRIR